MWHEAAISTAKATRVEISYLRQLMVQPFNDWNFAHNLNYHCFNLEQLGRPDESLSIAQALLAAPFDPKFNNPDDPEAFFLPFWEARAVVVRTLVKFERWETILHGDVLPWRDHLESKIWKAYIEALAHIGVGNLREAARRQDDLRSLQVEARKPANAGPARHYEFQVKEVEGLLALANGRKEEGIEVLRKAAELELEMRQDNNDPSYYPRVIYNVLGEALLDQNEPLSALEAFTTTLSVVRNDAIALAGLATAHARLGQDQKATEYYGRLLHVWSDADPPDPRWLEDAKKLGLSAQPKDESPGKQRRYSLWAGQQIGKEIWKPYVAPILSALDSNGERVRLDQFRGKNVLLIFYLGEECPHCMEQLVAVKKRHSEFTRRKTEVLAISGSSPDKNAESESLGKLGLGHSSMADPSGKVAGKDRVHIFVAYF